MMSVESSYYTWALMTPWGLESINKHSRRPRHAMSQSRIASFFISPFT